MIHVSSSINGLNEDSILIPSLADALAYVYNISEAAVQRCS